MDSSGRLRGLASLTHNYYEAFKRKGFPTNEQVYKDAGQYVVRHGDLPDDFEFRGRDLQISCCASSVSSVCKVALRREGIAMLTAHSGIVRSLNFCADKFGKERRNSVSVLLCVRCHSTTGTMTSIFALLVRAWYKPKWQLWCLGDALQEPSTPPFMVTLATTASRLSPELQIAKVCTTDELALSVARAADGGSYTIAELKYHMPHDIPNLLTMKVFAVEEMDTLLVRALANRALAELRGMSTDSLAASANEGQGFAAWQRSRRGGGNPQTGRRGNRASRQGSRGRSSHGVPMEVEPVMDEQGAEVLPLPPLVGVDEVGIDLFGDIDAEDMAEIIEGHTQFLEGADSDDEAPSDGDAHSATDPNVASDGALEDALAELVDEGEASAGPLVAASGDGRSAASSSREGVPDEIASPDAAAGEDGQTGMPLAAAPLDLVSGPSAGGYMQDSRTHRHIARVSPVFNKSISIKCFQHSRCQVAMAEWKLPARHTIAAWALNAELPSDGDTQEDREAKASRHMKDMKAIILHAQKPGRSRQALIDEAAADVVSP